MSERRKTVLIVDDDEGMRETLTAVLKRQYRILRASTGEASLQMMEKEDVDIMLLDVRLPGINGFEVLKILRSDPATAHIPVIAVSANAMQRDIDRGLKAGFFRYMTKPIRVDEFMEALDVALELAGEKLAHANE